MARKKTSTAAKKGKAPLVRATFEIATSGLPQDMVKKLERQVQSTRNQTKIIAKVLEQAGLNVDAAVAAAKSAVPVKEPYVMITFCKSIPRP